MSKKDIIGIEPYVQAIVEAIDSSFQKEEKEREGSFNVLISGQWGVGKTFILIRIDEELSKRGFKTFKFNPWKYSQSILAIKRKFLQELHEKFGGDVNLNSLYEGVEGQKQRDMWAEVRFIVNVLLRVLIYGLVATVAAYLTIQTLSSKLPNFFNILFKFVKPDPFEIGKHTLETAIVVGLSVAIIPAIKFVFENLAIKTKRAEVDSIEQFEEIFSRILSQKRHSIILTILNTLGKILKLGWRKFRKILKFAGSVLLLNIPRLAFLDGFCIRKWYVQKLESLLKDTKRTERTIKKQIKNFKYLSKLQTVLLEKKYKKVAILLDDLDRCQPDEVKNILDGFLTFFDQRNCAYVVTADHTVIERYIKRQLKFKKENGDNDTPKAYSTPKEYLHKIFNLNFLVPPPPKHSLQRLLEEVAKNFGLEDNETISLLAYNFFKRNPRAIKRFYTKVKFSVDVAKNFLKDEKVEEERRVIAKKVIEKPELRAKIIALEMVSPNFFALIVQDPQIAHDVDANKKIIADKKYFMPPGQTIEEKTKNWGLEEKDEIRSAEQILSAEPHITKELIAYESLIHFSSSTYSELQDTYGWPEIMQDMEKGSEIYWKVFQGTTDRGREKMRQDSLTRYQELKSGDVPNRHLFIKGMTELALASKRKGEAKDRKTIKWSIDLLRKLIDANETDDILVQLAPDDYSRLLEVVADMDRENEMLKILLSTNPFRKPQIIENVFKLTDPQVEKKYDGEISKKANGIIEKVSQAHKGVYEQ